MIFNFISANLIYDYYSIYHKFDSTYVTYTSYILCVIELLVTFFMSEHRCNTIKEINIAFASLVIYYYSHEKSVDSILKYACISVIYMLLISFLRCLFLTNPS